MRRAITVFAGIFDVHGEPRQVFQHDFASQPGMAARSACGNDNALMPSQSLGDGGEGFRVKRSIADIIADGSRKCIRLFIDLTQHSVRKDTCFERLRHRFPSFLESPPLFSLKSYLYGRLYRK